METGYHKPLFEAKMEESKPMQLIQTFELKVVEADQSGKPIQRVQHAESIPPKPSVEDEAIESSEADEHVQVPRIQPVDASQAVEADQPSQAAPVAQPKHYTQPQLLSTMGHPSLHSFLKSHKLSISNHEHYNLALQQAFQQLYNLQATYENNLEIERILADIENLTPVSGEFPILDESENTVKSQGVQTSASSRYSWIPSQSSKTIRQQMSNEQVLMKLGEWMGAQSLQRQTVDWFEYHLREKDPNTTKRYSGFMKAHPNAPVNLPGRMRLSKPFTVNQPGRMGQPGPAPNHPLPRTPISVRRGAAQLEVDFPGAPGRPPVNRRGDGGQLTPQIYITPSTPSTPHSFPPTGNTEAFPKFSEQMGQGATGANAGKRVTFQLPAEHSSTATPTTEYRGVVTAARAFGPGSARQVTITAPVRRLETPRVAETRLGDGKYYYWSYVPGPDARDNDSSTEGDSDGGYGDLYEDD